MANDKPSPQEDFNSNHLPLFFRNPTPLDKSKHGKLGLVSDFGLGFTRNVNSVPINMIELPQISHHYPIAFSLGESAQPVAILGLRDNENLFLNKNNKWDPDVYIPAYVRRYPFIFSQVQGNDQLTLCVDEIDEIVCEKSKQKFFDINGAPTQLTQNALEFCKSYQAAAIQTREFGKALDKSGLLVDRQVQLDTSTGKKINFSGFRLIEEERLGEMSDSDFLHWRSQGWLPFLYAQLFSGVQWQRLKSILNARLKEEARSN